MICCKNVVDVTLLFSYSLMLIIPFFFSLLISTPLLSPNILQTHIWSFHNYQSYGRLALQTLSWKIGACGGTSELSKQPWRVLTKLQTHICFEFLTWTWWSELSKQPWRATPHSFRLYLLFYCCGICKEILGVVC